MAANKHKKKFPFKVCKLSQVSVLLTVIVSRGDEGETKKRQNFH